LSIEIEHRSPKEQIEKNIRKNLKYADTPYIIASDEIVKKKLSNRVKDIVQASGII